MVGMLLAAALPAAAWAEQLSNPEATALCPRLGWSEFLPSFLKPKAAIPTEDTPLDAVDCQFHQWSWEAFVWATALDTRG